MIPYVVCFELAQALKKLSGAGTPLRILVTTPAGGRAPSPQGAWRVIRQRQDEGVLELTVARAATGQL